MNHLGRWLSALVDGELDGVERDRVLNHVAGCDACIQEANAMRALKRRLTALGETSAEPAIASKLIELAGDEDSPAGSVRKSARRPTVEPRPVTVRVARQIRPGWKVATGSAGSALIAIAFAAFLLGNGSSGPPAPKITPSVDSYLLQHSYDAGQEPAGAVGGSGGTGGYVGGGPYWSHQAASAPATPRPLASATASPAATAAGRLGGSARTHPASPRSK